jgi:hypothetical protein
MIMAYIELTPKDKIEILKNIDWRGIKQNETGLCTELLHVIGEQEKYNTCSTMSIIKQIDLFTLENSKQFSTYQSANRGWYWFDYSSKRGYKERKKFVKWMIKQYEAKETSGWKEKIKNWIKKQL